MRAAWIGSAALALLAPAADAEIVSAHLGVLAHNIQVIDSKNANKEDGPAIEGQLNFASPGFLSWAGAPTPYVVASLNTAGDTSFAGVGLEWHWRFAPGWSLNPGLGYVIHDGEKENPYPNGSPEAAAFTEEHVLLGSRDLFRSSIGVARELSDTLAVELFFSHLSHGQILGDGRNQGMDQAGVRLGWSF